MKENWVTNATQNAIAPPHLSVESQVWWSEIVKDFEIDDSAGLLLLCSALEQHDKARDCWRTVNEDGMVLYSATGNARPHPLIAVARDCRAAMISCFRQLKLNVEDAEEQVGRPTESERRQKANAQRARLELVR